MSRSGRVRAPRAGRIRPSPRGRDRPTPCRSRAQAPSWWPRSPSSTANSGTTFPSAGSSRRWMRRRRPFRCGLFRQSGTTGRSTGGSTGGTPLPIPEVQFMAGAPIGNTNRLRHGRFGAKGRARRQAVRALIAQTHHLIIRIHMVAKAREALKAKKESTSPLRGGRIAEVQRSGAKAIRVGVRNIDTFPPPGSLRSPTSPQGGGENGGITPLSPSHHTQARPPPAVRASAFRSRDRCADWSAPRARASPARSI